MRGRQHKTLYQACLQNAFYTPTYYTIVLLAVAHRICVYVFVSDEVLFSEDRGCAFPREGQYLVKGRCSSPPPPKMRARFLSSSHCCSSPTPPPIAVEQSWCKGDQSTKPHGPLCGLRRRRIIGLCINALNSPCDLAKLWLQA